MNASTSHRLREVEGWKDDPRFEIPPLENRNDLEPGEQAWLLVEFPEETAPAWAEIRKVLGPGWYLGRTPEGEVEFGSEHIFALRGPRYQMGAWYDHLPGAKARKNRPAPVPPPASQAPASARWFEFLPGGSRASARPSLFDFWKRGAPAEPFRPGETQKSFWDFFRRKPKTELSPIPPAERRETRTSPFRLPYGAQPAAARQDVIEVPQGPAEAPPAAQEPAQAAPQAIIVPEAQKGQMTSQEGGFRPPDDLFEVLAPETAPEARPAHPPGALIVGPEASHLPATTDAFSVLEPAPAEAFGPPAIVEAASPFTMLAPETPVESPFPMIQPEAMTPFDVLGPEGAAPEQGLVVRPSQEAAISSVFDVLEPQAQPLAPYQEVAQQQSQTVFDTLAPETPKPEPKKTVQRKPKKPKEFIEVLGTKLPVWNVPSREEWIKWIYDTYKPIENLWTHIRDNRTDDWFLDAMAYEEYGGEPALIPVDTWQDAWMFSQYMPFFDVPSAIWEPYADLMALEDEKNGYPEAAWEAMQDQVLMPLEEAVHEALKAIKPKDIPGSFYFSSDDGSGTWGLMYHEQLDPKEAAKRRKQIELRQQQDRLEAERRQAEAKEEEKHRKAQIKKVWGAMPKAKELVGWIETTYDVDELFSHIQKLRRSKGWKSAIKAEGAATEVLEVIADLGPMKAKDYQYVIASYFGIPPDIITLYQNADSDQLIWQEIFWPFLEILGDAFTNLLEQSRMPGYIRVDEDNDDHLALTYTEEEAEG